MSFSNQQPKLKRDDLCYPVGQREAFAFPMKAILLIMSVIFATVLIIIISTREFFLLANNILLFIGVAGGFGISLYYVVSFLSVHTCSVTRNELNKELGYEKELQSVQQVAQKLGYESVSAKRQQNPTSYTTPSFQPAQNFPNQQTYLNRKN